MSALSALLLGSLALRSVLGHSWAECTKYEAVVNGQDYEVDECGGYPRGFVDVNMKDFGLTNIAANTASNDEVCQSAIGDPDNDYSSTYADSGQWRMATYVLGESLRILWPAKNHAIGDECGESSSTSNQLKLFVNPQVNPTFDPSVGDVDDIDGTSSWVLLTDWRSPCNAANGQGVEGCGFANCPSYCDNTDQAVCFGDYVLDNSVFGQDGYYTFMWYWEFTGGSHYTTCWEAYVTTNGNAPSPTPQPVTVPAPVSGQVSAPVSSPISSGIQPISATFEGHQWWIRLTFSNIDASLCGDSIEAVQRLSSDDGTTWLDGNQANWNDNVYAWPANGDPHVLPVSIRFVLSSGNVVVLDDFVTSYDGGNTASKTICDAAVTVAAPDVFTQPTTAPTSDDVICVSQSSVVYIGVAAFCCILVIAVGLLNMYIMCFASQSSPKMYEKVNFDSDATLA